MNRDYVNDVARTIATGVVVVVIAFVILLLLVLGLRKWVSWSLEEAEVRQSNVLVFTQK
jgi:hypothetical protein